jgi:hypothetical protein
VKKMEFRFSAEEEEFRREISDFLDKEMTEEVKKEIAETGTIIQGPLVRKLLRKMGKRGWLAPNLPTEYGGLGLSYLHRFIAFDELTYHGGPMILAGAHWVAPVLLEYGSKEQKEELLPRIAKGEIEFGIAYTEPNAGSDVASLELSAIEDGDDFILNGGKIYHCHAHFAEYSWLVARTDFKAPKHRGISLFIVDSSLPGITVEPLQTMSGERTNEVYYDNVRVPKRYLVGERNKGFYYIMSSLEHERMTPVGDLQRAFELLVEYVKATKRDGEPLSKDVLVRQKLAEISTEIHIARLHALRIARLQDKGIAPSYEASMMKLIWGETWQKLANMGMQIMGPYGQLKSGSKGVRLYGEFERAYLNTQHYTIFMGTSEIMRNIIALRGLNLPR